MDHLALLVIASMLGFLVSLCGMAYAAAGGRRQAHAIWIDAARFDEVVTIDGQSFRAFRFVDDGDEEAETVNLQTTKSDEATLPAYEHHDFTPRHRPMCGED